MTDEGVYNAAKDGLGGVMITGSISPCPRMQSLCRSKGSIHWPKGIGSGNERCCVVGKY